MLLKILLWAIVGYLGGWIAARKGYWPRMGVIIAMVFGPLSLLVGLLLPKTKAGRQQAAVERELNQEAALAAERQLCPQCGREVSAIAWVCPRCSHRFRALGTSEIEASETH